MTSNIQNLLRRYRSKSDGATAIEMAIVFPLIIMILFAMLYVSLFFFGVNEAERYNSSVARQLRVLNNPDQAEITALYKEQLPEPVIGTFTPTVTIVPQFGTNYAKLDIEYTYKFDLPFMDRFTMTKVSTTKVRLRVLDK